MAELGMEIVSIEITKPLPDTGAIGAVYKIEGKAKTWEVGALPWVYAEVRLKKWYQPEIIEEVSYSRGFPMPVSGEFSIDIKLEKEGIYEVTLLASPAPLSLPAIGVPPVVGKSDMMRVEVSEAPPEELGFQSFRILSYSKNGGPPVTPPGILELDIGDKCRVNVGFNHRNAAVTGKFHAAIWQERWWDPHDEILNAEKNFSVPASADWEPFENYIDIPITSAISPGAEYGLYVKIMGITGGDIFTGYLANVITIVGVPEEELGFDLTRPTPSETPVAPGTTIAITCPVTSRCSIPIDARAKVIIYEGSLMPGHGDKIASYDSPVFHIGPDESKEIVVTHKAVEGTIDRRDVEVEIYVNGKLIKESEWDDVYYIETIEMELLEIKIDPSGTGTVTTTPAPSSGTVNNWYFPHDTIVTVTAHPKAGYVFKSWSGEMTDTTDITAPVYAMTEKRTITAHFKREAVYEGTISKKQLEYNGTRKSIPVSAVPLGERGLIHIWGRNDTPEAKRMGIGWAVNDPDGIVVEKHTEWEGWPYSGAGVAHEFIGGRFDLDKAGAYMMAVSLYMNPDAPVVVDRYSGKLCTVVGVPPESEFRNLRITSYYATVRMGFYCIVKAQFEYRGPEIWRDLYGAIGNYGFWGFDEIIHGTQRIYISESADWHTEYGGVAIEVTTAIDPKDSPYDLYVKVDGAFPDITSPVLENIITITD